MVSSMIVAYYIMFPQSVILPRKVRVFIDFLSRKFKEKNERNTREKEDIEIRKVNEMCFIHHKNDEKRGSAPK